MTLYNKQQLILSKIEIKIMMPANEIYGQFESKFFTYIPT